VATLYELLIGPAWDGLPASLRHAHRGGDGGGPATGVFRVEHGSGRAARALARLCRLPAAGEAVPVRLSVTREAHGERWTRRFGGHALVTSQRALAGGILGERFGPLEFRFRIAIGDAALRYQQLATRLCVGPLGVPLPGWLAPRITAREEAGPAPNTTRVRVSIALPLVGVLLAYDGELTVEEPATR
jgi:hypothetical protein